MCVLRSCGEALAIALRPAGYQITRFVPPSAEGNLPCKAAYGRPCCEQASIVLPSWLLVGAVFGTPLGIEITPEYDR
jgi:hypothetical protein